MLLRAICIYPRDLYCHTTDFQQNRHWLCLILALFKSIISEQLTADHILHTKSTGCVSNIHWNDNTLDLLIEDDLNTESLIGNLA